MQVLTDEVNKKFDATCSLAPKKLNTNPADSTSPHLQSIHASAYHYVN